MKSASCLILLGLVELAAGQGAQDEVAFEVLHVQGNVYMLASTLGNVTVQAGKDPGHDGLLLVDTGPVAMTQRLLAEIRKLSPEPVRFVVNTSADADHTGGNLAIAKPDARPYYVPPEVAIFAHDNVLMR